MARWSRSSSSSSISGAEKTSNPSSPLARRRASSQLPSRAGGTRIRSIGAPHLAPATTLPRCEPKPTSTTSSSPHLSRASCPRLPSPLPPFPVSGRRPRGGYAPRLSPSHQDRDGRAAAPGSQPCAYLERSTRKRRPGSWPDSTFRRSAPRMRSVRQRTGPRFRPRDAPQPAKELGEHRHDLVLAGGWDEGSGLGVLSGAPTVGLETLVGPLRGLHSVRVLPLQVLHYRIQRLPQAVDVEAVEADPLALRKPVVVAAEPLNELGNLFVRPHPRRPPAKGTQSISCAVRGSGEAPNVAVYLVAVRPVAFDRDKGEVLLADQALAYAGAPSVVL